MRDTAPVTDTTGMPETNARLEHVFPTLTAAQMNRIATYGRVREIHAGEILIEAGHEADRFFVVRSGRIDVLQSPPGTEQLVVTHVPGMFSGDVNMLSGRPSLVRMRAAEDGEVLELSRQQLMALVQTDSELGEMMMRAFILRRIELIARGAGDVVLIGSNHSAGTLRIKEFLTRNGHPYTNLDLDTDADVQTLLDRFHVGVEDVPVLICRGEVVLRNPSNQRIAECLGFNDAIDPSQIRDVVVVGAGPAGLAAAVYAASEGLSVLVIESNAPGGQAGSSSRIENYLGFPSGISGQELAGRAFAQAEKFGAQIMIAKGATRLACERRPYAIEVENGATIHGRTIIIATGAQYRRLTVPNVERFIGAGIYYGATFVESQVCAGEDVIVVGGGNSAGQAAVFLAESARRVLMIVRGESLAATMSRYLIRRIEQSAAIDVLTETEIVALEGDDRLERVTYRNRSGNSETRHVRHLFTMTGAVPATQWLEHCVALDARGFIRTGPDLASPDLKNTWPLSRAPHLLETSLPGVFAVGDVRAGNVKRVASAVGEGSIAVSFVHRVLAE
jgi:thioredoxin reductase (NADPH)